MSRYVPTVPASQIPYHCWCGFRGTLADQPAHRAEHRRFPFDRREAERLEGK